MERIKELLAMLSSDLPDYEFNRIKELIYAEIDQLSDSDVCI